MFIQKKHSTETALLHVQHDITVAMDDNQAALLVLLDMSAAFDTIDTDILLSTLHHELGVSDTPLRLFPSYMTKRECSVKIGNRHSSYIRLKYGVPQGSVLGPFVFTIYSSPVSKILEKYNISYHKFADDLQLYVFYRPDVPGDLVCALYRLKACIAEIQKWMTSHKLKLNDDKTEFLVLLSSHQFSKYGVPSLQLDQVLILPKEVVRNLGAYFDKFLTMKDFVNKMIQTSTFHLRRIGQIRKYITQSMCHSLVISLVMSHLDYCNCLLGGDCPVMK